MSDECNTCGDTGRWETTTEGSPTALVDLGPCPECTETCPHCGLILQGKEIPEESRELYGGKTHFSLKIGVEIRGVYDGMLFWCCPNCEGRWHRWPEGHYLRERANPYVEGEKDA